MLKTFFPDDYFCHFALLVTAIWLLTNDIITDSGIEIAKLLIQSYQWPIRSLYVILNAFVYLQNILMLT